MFSCSHPRSSSALLLSRVSGSLAREIDACDCQNFACTVALCCWFSSTTRVGFGRDACAASLLTTGSGRFPVRGHAPRLSRIMDDQGERTPERRTSDIQFHWSIRSHRHGSSGASPVGASRSLQALLSRQHVPALGPRVCMYSRAVAGPHDSVRENRSVALCCGKAQRSDDGDCFTSPRSGVSGPKFGEPRSPVFLHHDSGRAPGCLRSLPAWKRAQMPVDRSLTEMKSGYRADVEAAQLRSLLARRHVHAGYFRQVLVTSGAGHLSPQVADWHELKGEQEQ